MRLFSPAHGLECPSCHAHHSVYSPRTLVLACPVCGLAMDVLADKPVPLLPLFDPSQLPAPPRALPAGTLLVLNERAYCVIARRLTPLHYLHPHEGEDDTTIAHDTDLEEYRLLTRFGRFHTLRYAKYGEAKRWELLEPFAARTEALPTDTHALDPQTGQPTQLVLRGIRELGFFTGESPDAFEHQGATWEVVQFLNHELALIEQRFQRGEHPGQLAAALYYRVHPLDDGYVSAGLKRAEAGDWPTEKAPVSELDDTPDPSKTAKSQVPGWQFWKKKQR